MKTILALLALLCIVNGVEAQKKEAKKPPKTWEATNLQGEKRLLLQEKSLKATALLFITNDCPISNSYAPDWNALCKTYRAKRIAFYVVYVAVDAPAKEIQKHYKDFQYTCPALLDKNHALAKRVKATITPECVVLSPKGETLYQGRIDDRHIDFGVKRYAPRTRDLRDALDAIAQGKRVAVSKTKAVGCFIPN